MKNRSFLNTIGVLALGAVLSACDTGSVGNSSNPDTSVANSGFFYTGRAAASIDVANFQYYLWRNVIDESRCGDGCCDASTERKPKGVAAQTAGYSDEELESLPVEATGSSFGDPDAAMVRAGSHWKSE